MTESAHVSATDSPVHIAGHRHGLVAAKAAAAYADQFIDLAANEIRTDLAPMVGEGEILTIIRNLNSTKSRPSRFAAAQLT